MEHLPHRPHTHKKNLVVPKKKKNANSKQTGDLLRPPALLRHAPPRPGSRSPGRRRLLGPRRPSFPQGPQEPGIGRRGGDAGAAAVAEGRRPLRRRGRGAAVPGDGGKVQVAASQRLGELQFSSSPSVWEEKTARRKKKKSDRKKLTLSLSRPTENHFDFSIIPLPKTKKVKPGACAVESLPAPGSQYASDVCKGELARLMRR